MATPPSDDGLSAITCSVTGGSGLAEDRKPLRRRRPVVHDRPETGEDSRRILRGVDAPTEPKTNATHHNPPITNLHCLLDALPPRRPPRQQHRHSRVPDDLRVGVPVAGPDALHDVSADLRRHATVPTKQLR